MLRIFAWALCAIPTAALHQDRPIKVACLGDSITWGSRVVDRENNSYPSQLTYYLGAGWEVRNFGSGGKTLLRKADTPYVDSEPFQAALEWRPDVALIMLGANDSCGNAARPNWQHAGDLEQDASHLAGLVLKANPAARVILCAPTAMFPDARGLDEKRVEDLTVRKPRMAEVGAAARRASDADLRIEFLDLSNELRAGMTVDGVHTTPFGARAIASRTAEAVRQEMGTRIRWGGMDGSKESRFHGYVQHEFALTLDDEVPFQVRVVEPVQPAAGHPWIWRARFFGHEPELDRELLSRGYHVAYCDVGDLYGADLALDRWDAFYQLCTSKGLSSKVILEGMSRGGLVVLNWAARRPEAVEAIYVDNPVCDFRSWPGHQRLAFKDREWQLCLKAYGLTEERVDAYAQMPLDRLEPIAKADIPIFLVQGSADKVVLPEENGEELVRRYKELGGPIEVWRKPGKGHHPHGLHPVQPLLRALLRAGGRGGNPATHPMPSAEYRGVPAGWGGGTWREQVQKLVALAEANTETRLVFLGDSITQGLSGNQDRVGRADGERAFDQFPGALSLGLSGDRTQNLLYRIEHGALSIVDPQLVVVQIGVNNVNSGGDTGYETAEGLDAVVQSLLTNEPEARVLICGPFPTGASASHPKRRALDQVHVRAAELASASRVHYIDLRSLFIDEAGVPNNRMRGDFIHITPEGFKAWMDAIAPVVKELIRE